MTQPERLVDTANRLAAALVPTDLDDTLQAITDTAVKVLPQVDSASITLLHSDGTLETKAPTSQALVELDAHQYALREGPCYFAATSQPVVVSWNLAADDRFPSYGPLAVDSGIRSQAGLRLFSGSKAQGALNLYSSRPGAFEDFDELGALFATQAGTAIAYATEISNLKDALATRTTIGQAVGITMERYAMTDDRAFAFLTRVSQQRNVKLRLVAQEMIADSEQRGEDEA
jgi:GAF domain-containing protein